MAVTTSIVREISLYKLEHRIIEESLSCYAQFALLINPEHGQHTAAVLSKDAGVVSAPLWQ